MKILSTFNLCLLLGGLFLINITTAAQQTPSDVPPGLTPIDNTDEADPSISKNTEQQKQTTQTVQHGEQTEVKVTSSLGTYIVKPNQNVGTSLPGDTQSSSNHAVQWVIKSWGGSNGNEPETTPPVLQKNPNNPESGSQ